MMFALFSKSSAPRAKPATSTCGSMIMASLLIPMVWGATDRELNLSLPLVEAMERYYHKKRPDQEQRYILSQFFNKQNSVLTKIWNCQYDLVHSTNLDHDEKEPGLAQERATHLSQLLEEFAESETIIQKYREFLKESSIKIPEGYEEALELFTKPFEMQTFLEMISEWTTPVDYDTSEQSCLRKFTKWYMEFTHGDVDGQRRIETAARSYQESLQQILEQRENDGSDRTNDSSEEHAAPFDDYHELWDRKLLAIKNAKDATRDGMVSQQIRDQACRLQRLYWIQFQCRLKIGRINARN